MPALRKSPLLIGRFRLLAAVFVLLAWTAAHAQATPIACGETIEPTQVEFEVQLGPGAILRLHRLCHLIWQEECQTLPSC